jgi:hypothetical protein
MGKGTLYNAGGPFSLIKCMPAEAWIPWQPWSTLCFDLRKGSRHYRAVLGKHGDSYLECGDPIHIIVYTEPVCTADFLNTQLNCNGKMIKRKQYNYYKNLLLFENFHLVTK